MGWFDWLHKQTKRGPADPVTPQLVRAATDYLVRHTDPKLALCSRYAERLQPGVEATIRYLMASIKELPAPCDAAPANWASTPELSAFFVSPDDLADVFNRSDALHALFDANPLLDSALAVLGTTLIERQGLGIALDGEMLRRDVAQTSISFSNPRVHFVAIEEEDLHRSIGRRLLEEIAMVALERIEVLRAERKQLTDDRILLQARLQMLHQHGTGFDAHENNDSKALNARLDDNARALAAAGAGPELLDRELEILIELLAAPQTVVSVVRRTLRLDPMNLVVEGEGAVQREVHFAYARSERLRPVSRAVLQVRYPRAALRNVTLNLDDASRLLL